MNAAMSYRVSYDLGCLRSLKKLPDRVSAKFLDMMTRFMSDPSAHGLNFESVKGTRDRGVKSVRIDQGYRAIAFVAGQDVMFLHVNAHDEAYRWAEGRSVRVDPATNRIRVVEALEVEEKTEVAAVKTAASTSLFAAVSDERLTALGVLAEELPKVRQLRDQEALDRSMDAFDATSLDILIALAAGYPDEEIRAIVGIKEPDGIEDKKSALSFADIIASDESRQHIFIPETEEELRRVFEGDLEGWRIFLHPEQRRLAYRDYNGPALVRGGAGTGKTVVAMHRAKHLADQIAADPARTPDRILFTTFTTNLAIDIQSNMRTLCPEHLEGTNPRIEVINLDRWVSQFLKRKKYPREIVYFGENRERLDQIWREVLDAHTVPELSEEFIRAEWEQVVQAKGVMTESAYFRLPRTGRGTALDRRRRASLWKIFSDFRARMVDDRLAEPDDAYRDAIEILNSEAPNLPYSSVVVDEAQDMGEQAFRVVRAIVPERTDGDGNSIFIVGDAHQRIYGRRAAMSACGINVRGRSRQLRLNYRTSDEIRKWAVSILEGISVDDLDEGADSLNGYTSVFRGPPPELAGFSNEAKEVDALVEWLLATKALGTQLSDVGILLRTNGQIDQLARKLSDAGIENTRLRPNMADEREQPGVRLSTMHRAKGLEFQAVAIPFLSKSAFPPPALMREAADDVDRRNLLQQEKFLLHVAATRAKKLLRVSWSGEPSALMVTQKLD
ncbi:UvrD-helicase domain-containing protein [Bradyrhizobium ottawaense]|uniref:UvrD-helicase domain-containing protein n=1 Tax=Bradyrhizobium ottawaense TaxID=931866 RepID=UPI001BAB1F14|nr:UvrD-helicase domain-containing protein [Bradyrhizobium ottawaense]MBR1331738.1 AAA family ATPase [Bradyrhizobium ottawaense]